MQRLFPRSREDLKPVHDRPARWELVVLAVVLVVIGISRLPTLDNKLLEAGHAHRQTQTAYQTVTFHESGIDLLHPELPVLGHPWEIPFEMPLFQAVASAPMSWGISADVANRATALGFFVLTALGLWWLVRRIGGQVVAAVTVVVFSFSPFALVWSRASLIEFLATAAALGWVLAMVHWLDRESWWWVPVGVLAGSVATTVKITTALPWLIVVLVPSVAGATFREWLRSRLRVPLAAMVALPVIAGMAWTSHASGIKAASPATAAMTSTNLRQWATGTLDQRLVWSNHATVLDRINDLVMGPGVIVVALVAVVLIARRQPAWIGLALVPVLGIGAFFNLYVVHDYYLAAVSPALAALTALALVSLVRWLGAGGWGPIIGVSAVWLVGALWWAGDYVGQAYEAPRGAPPESVEIAALTEPDDRVMVGGISWDPRVLYYAERRGLMLYEPFVTREFVASLPDISSYRALYLAGPLSHLAEWAAIRPWYAPVTGNTLLLGSSLDDLGPTPVAASTQPLSQSVVGNARELGDLAGVTVRCDGEDSMAIPAGEGTLWAEMTNLGEARPVLRPGLAPVPSESSVLVWRPGEDGRRSETEMSCINAGSVRIERAFVTDG